MLIRDNKNHADDVRNNADDNVRGAEGFALPAAAAMLIIILMISALVLIYLLWYNGFFLADWQEKSEVADLNNDGKPEELRLSNRAFTVCRDGSQGDDEICLWNGREGWLTEDFLHGDIDSDGEEELLLLVWKRGSYGEYKPFWVEEDDKDYSQHIFIFKWTDDDKPDAVWMSSELNPGVRKWHLNEDGKVVIYTTECEDTLWCWNTWGLEREC